MLSKLFQISYKLGQEAKILFKRADLGTKAVIVNDKGNILLVRHSYKGRNLWYLPGGAIHLGENPKEAVKREIIEETGIKIDTPRLVGIYNKSVKPAGLTFVFFTKAKEVVNLSTLSEIEEAKFFKRKSFPNNMAPGVIKRVNEALDQKSRVQLEEKIIWGKW